MRGGTSNRTYGKHKNLYISLFLLTIFGPVLLRSPVIVYDIYLGHGSREEGTAEGGATTFNGRAMSDRCVTTLGAGVTVDTQRWRIAAH